MKNWGICILIFFGIWVNAYGQEQTERKLVQFSGFILNADSNITVPYVTLTNHSYQEQIFNANHQGFFSFVAHEGDTIRLSAVGYLSETLVVPKSADNSVTVKVSMKSHIIDLPVVTIYPWASIDEFNYDFMNLKIADDDYLIAQKNLSTESLMAMARDVPRNAAEIQNMDAVNRHIGLSNKVTNQRHSNALFSPLAWANFINQISQGNKSRKK
ncbi:hypothetical protein H8S90_06210 [Olivibacter sp. SDN3]|uniref:hypothetical protein n=1 Tax=Olivibacter sp. SDN3 TaxID=2764720 RepID=UPI0016511C93|nr:hypothetical protein [Olivibacter sp. SDN3]QNL51175.1 hypothetical protein H8S90_06210 [Olivibacter sp. SDN3]